MKIYKNFGELKNAPKEIFDYFIEMECHEPPVDERDFLEYYGGYVCVVESEDDLKEIPTTKIFDDNRWMNILETADSFDACRWIADDKYVEIYLATTDAGGASFFIPKEIADKCPNVLRSIEMSTEAWS